MQATKWDSIGGSISDTMAHFNWFAVQVRPRYENIAASLLRAKGYDEFLPLYTSRRRWSDRVKNIELPLFPGYLFCRMDPLLRLPVLMTPGVISIIGVGRIPVPVEDSEIEAVRTIVQSGVSAEPCPFLHVGQRVEITDGPLAGIDGQLIECRNSHRLVVSVPLLQRSVSVELQRGWVSPLPESSKIHAGRMNPAMQLA